MQKPKHIKQPDLTIVIPAYCEERRIGTTLDALAAFLKRDAFFKSKEVEVIVVAADTPDKTHQIVMSKQRLFKDLSLLKPGPHVGKGRDVQYGMLRARGTYVLFMDADLATPLDRLQTFYQAGERGYDVVIGERNHRVRYPNPIRYALASLATMLFSLISGVWAKDTQCGFKLFSAQAAQLCFSKLTILGWWFDMEALVIAKSNHLKILGLPIDDWQPMPFTTFTDTDFRKAGSFFADVLRICRHRLSGKYRA